MVKLAANGFGGLIQGNFGQYVPASDGTVNVDPRDVAALLLRGFTFINAITSSYVTPNAPVAAAVGYIVASGSLSNGGLTIAHQPDVIRPVQFTGTAGTSAITAGTLAVAYIGNDGQTGTDTFSLITGANGGFTFNTSRCVAHVNTAIVSGLTGGASPWIAGNVTASIGVPVSQGAVNVTFLKENIDTGDETVGTASTVTLGAIAPTTAPNATHTYAFLYTQVTPDQ